MPRSRMLRTSITLLASAAVWFHANAAAPYASAQDGNGKPAVQEPTQDPNQLFEPREFNGAKGGTLKYRLLKPKGYNPERKYPVVIFLHGAGERGADNKAQLKHGMAEFCKTEWRDRYPCYVIAPQCPEGRKWSEVDWSAPSSTLPEKISEPLGLTLELVDAMIADAAVNPNRIYLTGLSMGGYGTWDALARRPEFFAAAIPICGGGDPKTAAKFAKVPLWCFHGDDDKAVAVNRSREMIEALKTAGGEPKYTEYPGVGHDSWTRTYANPEVIDWMFRQLLSKASDSQ
ncbi:MAG: prolyl oligopeptidase family serine peptidase [Pirellulales bacterium]